MTRSQRSELTKLFHVAIVARWGDKCLRCGNTQRIAASHIYPKGTYRKMEFDTDNGIPLCYRCHIHFWHKNPIEAHEWLKTKLPERQLERLKMRVNYIDKTLMDFNLIKLFLESEIKKYANRDF